MMWSQTETEKQNDRILVEEKTDELSTYRVQITLQKQAKGEHQKTPDLTTKAERRKQG